MRGGIGFVARLSHRVTGQPGEDQSEEVALRVGVENNNNNNNNNNPTTKEKKEEENLEKEEEGRILNEEGGK